ncbi:hypothetical protein D3C85_1088480 [compost metagenome]
MVLESGAWRCSHSNSFTPFITGIIISVMIISGCSLRINVIAASPSGASKIVSMPCCFQFTSKRIASRTCFSSSTKSTFISGNSLFHRNKDDDSQAVWMYMVYRKCSIIIEIKLNTCQDVAQPNRRIIRDRSSFQKGANFTDPLI